MREKKKNKVIPPLPVAASTPKKIPNRLVGADVNGIASNRPVWRLSLLDHEHAGSWSWAADTATMVKIAKFLGEMERLTWSQIRAQMTGSAKRRGALHKSIPIYSLAKEARDRLTELSLDDWDELFRFRLGNMERLWGIVVPDDPPVFYAIWWDAGHSVCPSADR